MHVLEQVGRDRPLRLDERALVGQRVRCGEGASLVEAEVLRAPAIDRKSAHRDTVDDRLPGGELVLPGPVVARRRRRDLNIEVGRETLDEGPGVRLGAAPADIAVALHDDHEARRHAAVSATSCARRASNASHDDSRSTHLRPAAPSASRAAIARSSDGPNSAASRYATPPPERATWPA